jgi:hypothetical protein
MKFRFLIPLVIFLIIAALLASGSPLLLLPIGKHTSIPLGNLLTWLGMFALPLTAYWGINSMRNPSILIDRLLSNVLKLVLLMALLWLPISYLLAGNLSFTFTEKDEFQGGQLAMKVFWIINYCLPIATLLILLLNLTVSKFIKRNL